MCLWYTTITNPSHIFSGSCGCQYTGIDLGLLVDGFVILLISWCNCTFDQWADGSTIILVPCQSAHFGSIWIDVYVLDNTKNIKYKSGATVPQQKLLSKCITPTVLGKQTLVWIMTHLSEAKVKVVLHHTYQVNVVFFAKGAGSQNTHESFRSSRKKKTLHTP